MILGQIRENFAVKQDVLLSEAPHQAAVGDAHGLGSGADFCLPKTARRALFLLSPDKRVGTRVQKRLAREPLI